MFKFFSRSMGALLSISFLAQVALANSASYRQKRLAIYHVEQTEIGRSLLLQLDGAASYLESIQFADLGLHSLYRVMTHAQYKPIILLNSNLITADARYTSWILAMGLADLQLKRLLVNNGGFIAGTFLETSTWSFLVGQKYWNQAKLPSAVDSALSSDKDQRHFAEQLNASSNRWNHLYITNIDQFVAAVLDRHLQLGYDSFSLNDVLESTRYSNDQKQAARHALESLQRMVDNSK